MSLFPDLVAQRGASVAGIALRCCDVADLLREVRGAKLVIADPPWQYSQSPGVANPEENDIFAGLSDPEIVAHLDATFDCAGPDARLAVWYTFPKDQEWSEAGNAGKRWGGRTSGGAWIKSPHVGVGYHWRGWVEPVALFTKGTTGRPNHTAGTGLFGNGHISAPDEHSYKPVAWMRRWIRAWTDPGDLVLDVYAGLGSVAVACALEGRRYVGAEIDPERHRRAGLRVADEVERAQLSA